MASGITSDLKRFRLSEADPAEFYPFRMTKDHRTEMYVKFAKVMLIFQGAPCDERKNAVESLVSKFKYAGRLISDQTFKRETGRIFSAENTDKFYSYFRERVKKSCEDGYNLIIIDQSLNNPLQMQYYFYIAQKMQYVILMYPPQVKALYRFGGRDNLALELQEETERRVRHESSIKHLFCGWFLHDVDSAELREEAGLYVQDCYDNILDFKDMFSKICETSDFLSHYNMVNKRQNLAFCAVKIFQSIMDADRYLSTKTFSQFYGSMSKLYIVGFVISPHMVAARIRLTHEQRKLWEMSDDLNENAEVKVFPSALVKKCEVDLPAEEITLIASKSNRTLINGEDICKPLEGIASQQRGRSCHIVLGRVKGANVRNIDYDVAFAIFRERKVMHQNSRDFEPYELDRCFVRRIGKYWIIYLKQSLIVNGFFSTCCLVEN